MMPQHETKTCPRCNRAFECKQGNINECQCQGVRLQYDERVYLENRYIDCLCAHCLEALKFEYRLYCHKIFRFDERN